MQSVSITITVFKFNPDKVHVYLIQTIKDQVRILQKAGGFLWILLFPPPIQILKI